MLALPLFLSGQGYYKVEVRGTNCAVSNHEADLWYFGQNAGIDFRGDEAVPALNNDVLHAIQGSANICDSLGNLLMMTDGTRVWNKIEALMPNGTGLQGDPGVSMPAIIIPKPGNPNIYYIFTVDRPKFGPFDASVYGLRYSEVDITLPSLGDVTVLKNKPLVPEVSEKITAVKHQNGIDYWVVAHEWNSSRFVIMKVTADGVDTLNIRYQSIGTSHEGTPPDNRYNNNALGFMKFSPDGSKLAIAIQGKKMYEIYNFSNGTGDLSLIKSSDTIYSGAYGVEFSPDSKFLYASTAFVGGTPDSTSRLYQFSVDDGPAIFDNPVELAVNTTAEYFCGLQLATDGRIYVARSPYGNDVLGVIYNPKRPGLECNFNMLNGNPSEFSLGGLPGKRSRYGFPSFIQSYFDVPHFDVEMVCFSDTTSFKLTNPANVTSISWDFGDPNSGGSNTSNLLAPTHVFSAPGTYNVTVLENGVYSYNETINVVELPFAQLPDTTYMYKGSAVLLDAGDGFVSYLWSTGETTSKIKASEPGVYYVMVQNDRCCFNTDSVTILLFDIVVPNAFRPGGTNSVFRAVPSSEQAIQNFSMYIFDRWGQQMFESKNIADGWDGKVKGKDAPGDVYVWIIYYDVEREGKQESVAYKGNVMLLR